MTLQFVYQGFTQNGNDRCYSFNSVEEHQPARLYVISVDLGLFVKHQVSLQSGPLFCLKLLREACEAGIERLDECRDYHANETDFSSLMTERAARAAAVALKRPARRFVRKPPITSQLSRLGRPVGEETSPTESKAKP
jgi:hypothetical protein